MKIISTFLSIPKRGNQPNENEDAFFPREELVSKEISSFAIADGASEGLLSSMWSNLLTIGYVNYNEKNINLFEFLKFCCETFETFEKKFINDRETDGKPLQWYEQNLLLKGSFSTLLGITIFQKDMQSCSCKIRSIGDSFLFLIQENNLTFVFPTNDLSFFGNRPDLIPTDSKQIEKVLEKIVQHEHILRDGDIIYLMTDAIAHWFLGRHSEGFKPWGFFNLFPDLKSKDFIRYIEQMRHLGSIKNDDITIARLTIKCDV